MDELKQTRDVLEAALLVAGEPMTVAELGRLFEPAVDGDIVRRLLDELRSQWDGRSVELAQVASGWRFQARPEIQRHLERIHPERPPKYSRAVMETLAIIAYQQPVTRGDIEAIRGVPVSSHIVKVLEDRQWIEAVGHKETPGRPALYATTKKFLDDLGLRSLTELPPLADLDPSHLLEFPDAPSKATEAGLTLASPSLPRERTVEPPPDYVVDPADDAGSGTAKTAGTGEAAPAGTTGPKAGAPAGPARRSDSGSADGAAGGPAVPSPPATLH